MNSKKIIYILLLIVGFCGQVYAQNTQTVRGTVTDIDTRWPLTGVTVILVGSDPLIGTTTDIDGNFILVRVPVGRQSLQFTYLGYEPRIYRDIAIESGRQVVLDVQMKESVTQMDELVVTAVDEKDVPINVMAVAGARLLSVEEASRFAGGFDDPARLASAFAGVSGTLSSNAIVVRGNAPKGLLWRMEGVEIPTPSHFANLLTIGGGGITALSSHMLANSDFYTGAFPAEFGNATSGVFDVNLRSGNNQKRETTLKTGIIGLDVGLEGPFRQGGNASYLFNYRYSTFSLISSMLPEDAGNIRYQNASFKLNLPSKNSGTWSLWGIGAMDTSGEGAEADPSKWVYNQDREKNESPTRFGAIGLQNRYLLNRNTYVSTSVTVSGNGLNWDLWRYNDEGTQLYNREYIESDTWKYTFAGFVNSRISKGHTNRTGFILNQRGYAQQIRKSESDSEPVRVIVDAKGETFHGQFYTQSRFDYKALSFTGGVHFQYLQINDEISAEPRAGLQYHSGGSKYSLAYGRHRQMEAIQIYLGNPLNRKLKLTQADHFVAGFSRRVGVHTNLSLEAYYQILSRVPVIADSSFSMINLELDWFIRDALESDGKGRNYGVDMTLERYFYEGWYYLVSGTLFQSEYRGGDGVWRDTRFNRNYIFSILGGKEFVFAGRATHRTVGLNGRINYMGGNRYTPANNMLSEASREVMPDESKAFALQYSPVFYADVTIELRTNREKWSTTWALQLMNVSGYKEQYGQRFNLRENRVENHREAIVLPNLSWKISF